MTRVEYIRQLEFSLNGKLPKREISEILRDYSEYFEAGKMEGKTEEEIAISLGIPSVVAAQILSETEEDIKKQGKAYEQERRERQNAGNTEGSGIFERIFAWIKALFGRISDFVDKSFSRKPLGYGAPPHSASTQKPLDTTEMLDSSSDPTSIPSQAPSDTLQAKPSSPSKKTKKPKEHRGSFAQVFVSVLLFILLFPLILLAALTGVILLGIVVCSVVGLVLGLAGIFVFLLISAFLGSAAAVVLGAGSYLPWSLLALAIVSILFCVAGAVLSICLIIYLLRWLVKATRYCFAKTYRMASARNPVYQAAHRSAQASSPIPDDVSPAPGASNGYDAASCEGLSHPLEESGTYIQPQSDQEDSPLWHEEYPDGGPVDTDSKEEY